MPITPLLLFLGKSKEERRSDLTNIEPRPTFSSLFFFFQKSRVINSVIHAWFNPWALLFASPLLNGTIFQVTIRQHPPLTLMLGTATRYDPHPEYPFDHLRHLESKAFTSSVCELDNITIHSFYNLCFHVHLAQLSANY